MVFNNVTVHLNTCILLEYITLESNLQIIFASQYLPYQVLLLNNENAKSNLNSEL